MPNWWMELDINKNIFVNISEKILVAFWYMCYKVIQLKRRLSKRCTRLQARMHTQACIHRGRSPMCFSQNWNKFEKYSLNTLVNCMTQPVLFINTIFKVSKKLLFSHFIEKYFLLWIMFGCGPGFTVFTLKTIQLKTFG